jgi:hypothetical protein
VDGDLLLRQIGARGLPHPYHRQQRRHTIGHIVGPVRQVEEHTRHHLLHIVTASASSVTQMSRHTIGRIVGPMHQVEEHTRHHLLHKCHRVTASGVTQILSCQLAALHKCHCVVTYCYTHVTVSSQTRYSQHVVQISPFTHEPATSSVTQMSPPQVGIPR